MGVLMRSILALILCLALGAGQTLAITGDDDSRSARNPDYLQAVKLLEAGDYAGAIPLLQKSVAADSSNADAYNLLGFSHRRLGQVEAALAHYGKALALEPEHRGANEYLGELYLELGQLDQARERLDVLDDACIFGCPEYRELKAKIEAYRAEAGS
jgi:tetratricopeptide (TPR) repeat protein